MWFFHVWLSVQLLNIFILLFCIKVETNVRVQSEDGQISITHDPIIIDGVQLVLVPASAIITTQSTENHEVECDVNSNG